MTNEDGGHASQSHSELVTDVRVLTKAYGPASPHVAVAHCAVASSCLQLEERNEAEAEALLAYQSALSIYSDRYQAIRPHDNNSNTNSNNSNNNNNTNNTTHTISTSSDDMDDEMDDDSIPPPPPPTEAPLSERRDHFNHPSVRQNRIHEPVPKESIVDRCNAATTLHNMSILHKRCGRVDDAIACDEEALGLYRLCLQTAKCLVLLPLSNTCKDEPTPTTTRGSANSDNAPAKRVEIPLEFQLIQTLQCLAVLYSKYKQNMEATIRCHEEIASLLLLDEEDIENSHDRRHVICVSRHPGTESAVVIRMDDTTRAFAASQSLHMLGKLYSAQGDDDHDVLGAYHEALDLLQSIQNTNNTNTTTTSTISTPTTSATTHKDPIEKEMAMTHKNLGYFHMKRKELDLALDAFSKAHKSVLAYQNMDGTHPDVICALHNLGICHERRGELDKAMQCYERVYMIRARTLGEDHVDVADAINNMSNILQRKGDLDAAMELYEAALLIYKRQVAVASLSSHKKQAVNHVGRNETEHVQAQRRVAGALQNMGSVHLKQNDIDAALEVYQEAIAIRKSALGDTHLDVAQSYHMLGTAQLEKSLVDAKRSFETSLQLYRSHGLGEKHSSIVSSIQNIQSIKQRIAEDANTRAIQKVRDNMMCGAIYVEPSLPVYRYDNNSNESKDTDDESDVYADLETEDDSDFEGLNAIETTYPLPSSLPSNPQYSFRRDPPPSHMIPEIMDDGVSNDPSRTRGVKGMEFVAVRRFDADESDTVSVITFREHDVISVTHQDEDGGWWWGVTEDGNEGWFPSEYVTKVVDAIEEAAGDFFNAPGESAGVLGTIPDDIEYVPSQDDDDSNTLGLEGPSFMGESPESKRPRNKRLDSKRSLDTSKSPAPSGEGFEVADLSHVELPENDYAEETEAAEFNMDDLLRQMNVVHSEMKADDGAKPFGEVLQKEKTYDSKMLKMEDMRMSNKLKPKITPKRDETTELKLLTQKLRKQQAEKQTDPIDILETHVAMARRYWRIDNPNKAIKHFLEALRIEMDRKDNKRVIDTLRQLGKLYFEQKRWDASGSCVSEAKRISSKLYGDKSETTARLLNQLGKICLEQEEFEEAMANHEEALTVLRKIHSKHENHPDILDTLANIGSCYYKERNCLTKIRTSEEEYQNFIASGMLDKIAHAHEQRGTYTDAIMICEEKLQLLQNRGNSKAIKLEIALTLNYLGRLSLKMGRHIVSMEYHSQALKMFQNDVSSVLTVQKRKHAILKTQISIGMLEYHSGHFGRAMRLFEEVLVTHKSSAPKDKISKANCLAGMGLIQIELCDYDTALKLLQEPLAIRTKELGSSHPDTLLTRVDISRVYSCMGKIDMALSELNMVLTSQREIYGGKHPCLATTLHHLGVAYARNGKLHSAMKCYEECFLTRESMLGDEHPAFAMTLHSIGAAHASNKRFEKALRIYQDALRIRKEVLGDRHIDVARTLANIGSAYSSMGKTSEAMPYYNQAFELAHATFGAKHPSVADIYVNMGNVHLRKCAFDEAKEKFNDALMIYKASKLPPDHPKIAHAQAVLARVKHEEDLCV